MEPKFGTTIVDCMDIIVSHCFLHDIETGVEIGGRVHDGGRRLDQ
jgi:hypothetical protein